MSRMIKFTRPGGPEVLEFIEVETLSPGSHEVRIKVKQSASTGLTQCGAMTNMSNRRYSRLVWDMTLPALSMPSEEMLLSSWSATLGLGWRRTGLFWRRALDHKHPKSVPRS